MLDNSETPSSKSENETPKEIRTSGEYKNETEACSAFDEIMEMGKRIGAVDKYFREVKGRYEGVLAINATPGVYPKVDRIVFPGKELIKAGWPHGPFSVEIKCSGMKVGPVVNQAIDYSLSLFQVYEGYWIRPEWTFIFPLQSYGGDLESIMANHRIGSAYINKYGIRFRAGSCSPMAFGSNSIEGKRIPCGNKMGSR